MNVNNLQAALLQLIDGQDVHHIEKYAILDRQPLFGFQILLLSDEKSRLYD